MDESIQEGLQQIYQERQQLAVECLRKLASHQGGEREIQFLADELGISEFFRRPQ